MWYLLKKESFDSYVINVYDSLGVAMKDTGLSKEEIEELAFQDKQSVLESILEEFSEDVLEINDFLYNPCLN
ncbi:MAG: hypothetical protein ACOCUU_03190 [Nanoarchaeota archaeon]